MMRRLVYAQGLFYVIENWPTASAPFGWALVDQFYVPNEVTLQYMDSVAGFEFVDAAYVRQVAANLTTTVVAPGTVGNPGYVEFGCDDPDFGVMSDGNSAAGLVLFGDSGLDSTSPIIAVYPVGYTATGGSSVFFIADVGAVVVTTVCPSQFQTWGS